MSGLRQIAPHPPADGISPGAASTRQKSNSRARAVASACEACRKRKSKCDGERPCGGCSRRRTDCQYETRSSKETHGQASKRKFSELEEKHEALERLINVIKRGSPDDAVVALSQIRNAPDSQSIVNSVYKVAAHAPANASTDTASAQAQVLDLLIKLPDGDAQAVLQQLRSKVDPLAIVQQVQAGDILLQMALAPESRFRYDLPDSQILLEDGVASSNPYLSSILYEASPLRPLKGEVNHSTRVKHDSSSPSGSVNLKSRQDLFLKPLHGAEVVEPKLADAKVSAWTSVCSDDRLMRNLISVWLRCEYSFTAALQKDLFLEDLAAGEGEFCSALLVNIVLGYACVCNPRFKDRAEYWNPQTLTYRFTAEAKRLWESEAHKPRLTTVQAGILFNVYYNLCGLDQLGQHYRVQAISLARQMNLFDDDGHGLSKRMRHGTAFTAWALFNWETLVGFSFVFAPLLSKPPSWPLPSASDSSDWYGEIWLRYPMGHRLMPSCLGQVLEARSRFRVIMNQACQAAYGTESGLDLETAYALRSSLTDWYEKLPEQLLPTTIVLPGHLSLHQSETAEPRAASPHQIVTEARTQLKLLVRLYYLRHGFEAMDLFIVIPLMLIATDCLDAINNTPNNIITHPSSVSSIETNHTGAKNTTKAKADLKHLQSTLVLVTSGLYNQCRNHYLAHALFRVIRGQMQPTELALLNGLIVLRDSGTPNPTINHHTDSSTTRDGNDPVPDPRHADTHAHEQMKHDMYSDDATMTRMTQPVHSTWPVSVVRDKQHTRDNMLGSLVERYAHLNITQ